jgi:branched-chain amino acid transport system permease protein
MDFSIALILLQDGVTSGAIYALLALAVVLVFSITRVILIPQGEFVAFGALTLAALQAGATPGTVWLLVVLGCVTFLLDIWSFAHAPREERVWMQLGMRAVITLLIPIAILAATSTILLAKAPIAVQMALTMAIVTPLGPWIYRLAVAPIANSSILTLLIVAVALHFCLLGLGLQMFGPEGVRTLPLLEARWQLGELQVSAQSLLAMVVCAFLMVALWAYFSFTMQGKALRATASNRLGSRLVGVSPTRAGQTAFAMAAGLGALSGTLIAPLTTVYYDSGFLIGLKGFVGSIVGGLASYPIAAAGAVFVGVVEAWGSFAASEYKEVIVFTLIVPVLVWRSLTTHVAEES